ncbi:MAG: TrmH family RNA methyltransferase [Bacteroidaceae bacterium]|nr:TrmH family RNA methyltransferase [Bacteroidaceae bacterium]
MRKLNVTELGRIDIEQFKNSKKLPLTIILDDVRSLYNVGSVFRTSDAFRIERIILCGITATPDNSLVEIHKTALGAEESVEWIYSNDCVSVVKDLNDKGYITVAVEQVEGSHKLDEFKVQQGSSYALVLGNEVKGVNQDVVDICKMSLEIPQYGTKHSLNVSVTAGVVIWEFYKQLKGLL